MECKWLVVDLDGTLVNTNMLYESFWSSLSSDKRVLFKLLPNLSSGRARIKRILSESSQVLPELLPYNRDVIKYIEEWKQVGGKVALVTASDQQIADMIADHLSLFDEVKGSDGAINLKGEQKAEYLSTRYGDQSFIYIGDSTADLAVWKHSKRAVTYTNSTSLKTSAEAISLDAIHLNQSEISPKEYLRALRPHQWLKNTLVFLPLIAAHEFSYNTLYDAIITFISFSLIASSVYLINDLLDLSYDRSHHRKKNRPLAAGSIPIAHGTIMAPFLLFSGLLIAYLVDMALLWVVISYFALTFLYSLSLKHIVIVDTLVLAILYSLRIYAGGVATDIALSVWLITFSFFLFFSLAAVKRQAELVETLKSDKKKLFGRGYEISDLQVVTMMAIASGYVSALVLTLYINSDDVLLLYTSPQILLGICVIFFFWINRMVLVTHRGNMHDDPLVFSLTDRTSQICFILITFFIGGAMFL